MRLAAATAALLLAAAGHAQASESCEAQLAATRDFRNGAPTHAMPLPEGRAVVFLMSGPRDTDQHLFRTDLGGGTRELASAASLGAPGTLTVEEKARRERARLTSSGITDVAVTRDGHAALVQTGGQLATVDTASGQIHRLPGAGWIAPQLSPDGTRVAAVRDNDVHVLDLATGHDTQVTTGGTDLVTHGLAEFAAEEELDRLDGFFWSPGGDRLVVETADNSPVEQHFIADPSNPAQPPTDTRYPRAGTPNANVTLGIVPAAGGRATPIDWDRARFPYVARVVWPARGALSLVVLDRDQTHERVLAVDPATGATHTLLEESDSAWIDLTEFAFARNQMVLPAWLPDGSGFLWASERSGQWQLELRHADGSLDHALTPAGFRFSALLDLAPHAGVVISGGPDRLSELLYRVPLAGGRPVPIATERGLHEAAFGAQHAIMADDESLADGSTRTVIRAADGHVMAVLPSRAEHAAQPPRIEFTTSGADGYDTAIIRPHDWHPGQRLPAILAVYGGPGFKQVRAAGRLFAEDQCMADHGAIVVTLDGHGTPGRGRDWSRATKFDLIDRPLADQVAGLQSVEHRIPDIDPKRVAVMGWSFGGTFTAMATLRRPDIFAAGVAGAPVTDWRNYDTAYTERYLGLPAQHPDAYKVSSVVTYAGDLQRPLLLVHGLTDDNVYFVNTFELIQALLKAGKPYELVLLPGTHMLADPTLRAAEQDRVDTFLHRTIGLH